MDFSYDSIEGLQKLNRYYLVTRVTPKVIDNLA